MQREGREEGRKGKDVVVDMDLGEVSIQHRCAFDSNCSLTEDLGEIQKEAIHATVWALVLQYKKFTMDRHMVVAMIESWNLKTKSFRIKRRDVPFSYFDVALLTGLPATSRPVVFKRGEDMGEVDQLLIGAMDNRLTRERNWPQTVGTMGVHIYRNYASMMLDLCRRQKLSGESYNLSEDV